MIVDVMKFRRTPSEGRTLDENNLRAEPTITTTVLVSGITALVVPNEGQGLYHSIDLFAIAISRLRFAISIIIQRSFFLQLLVRWSPH